jgi:hypothetical protein
MNQQAANHAGEENGTNAPSDSQPHMYDEGGDAETHDESLEDNHPSQNEPGKHPIPMQKRRRVTRACDECRRKKIKCDGKQPCTHCTVYSYGKSLEHSCDLSKGYSFISTDTINRLYVRSALKPPPKSHPTVYRSIRIATAEGRGHPSNLSSRSQSQRSALACRQSGADSIGAST